MSLAYIEIHRDSKKKRKEKKRKEKEKRNIKIVSKYLHGEVFLRNLE
jgi:hypothetical protein